MGSITGNPPYVRRAYLSKTRVKQIRRSVVKANAAVEEDELKGLTDLYVYFLLRSIPLLRPGGRLAVITADSWLNTSYGRYFKEQLHGTFNIERLISLDRRVFDASVKPVLILATKRPTRTLSKNIEFLRLKNGLPIKDLQLFFNQPGKKLPNDVVSVRVKRSELDPSQQWGTYFKAPDMCETLSLHKLMAPLSTLGPTRIGIQTLAKDFFVLSSGRAKELKIESRFLRPLAPSTRCFNKPIIDINADRLFFLFYCSETKKALKGTNALAYIKQGETAEVPVRGKGTTVIGYHNKKRIQEDKRNRWYDLKTALVRRSCATILIPRLIYRTFTVVWNKAGFVPGELFIEFLPKSGEIETEVYLAALSSSITEIMLRSTAQVYGAGTYNISPGLIKNTPVLNVQALNSEQKQLLKKAYRSYSSNPAHDRTTIDEVVYQILGFDSGMRQKLEETLNDMHLLATSARQSGSVHHQTV